MRSVVVDQETAHVEERHSAAWSGRYVGVEVVHGLVEFLDVHIHTIG